MGKDFRQRGHHIQRIQGGKELDLFKDCREGHRGTEQCGKREVREAGSYQSLTTGQELKTAPKRLRPTVWAWSGEKLAESGLRKQARRPMRETV